MIRIRSVTRLMAAAIVSAAVAAPTLAGFVVVPGANTATEGDLDNTFPYLPGGTMRYQQVFNASEFSAFGGPQTITDIRYRLDGSDRDAFSQTQPNVQIGLSTTAAAAGGLSSTFASNVGADATTVYNGSLTLASAGGSPLAPFDIVISLSTPFVYDPAAGNLLLDVRNFGGNQTSRYFDAVASSPVTSRVYASDVNSSVANGSAESYALVTGFTFGPAINTTNPVPAPPAALALALGAAGLGLIRRRVA